MANTIKETEANYKKSNRHEKSSIKNPSLKIDEESIEEPHIFEVVAALNEGLKTLKFIEIMLSMTKKKEVKIKSWSWMEELNNHHQLFRFFIAAGFREGSRILL